MRTRRVLLVAALVLLSGCATKPQPSPEETRLVELLRQGRVEEAGRDTFRIARAIAIHVEELTDPREVLAAADWMWKGYPFSIADLEIDVELLERVAVKEAEARAAVETRRAECGKATRMDEFQASIEPHGSDGGRCARVAYIILRKRALAVQDDDFGEIDKLKRILDFMVESFGTDPFVLLAGLRVEQATRRAGASRYDAFALRSLHKGRWNRLLRGHLAWLRATCFKWESDWNEFGEAAEVLAEGGPELKELAGALRQFYREFWECKREKDGRAALDLAVAKVEAVAPGSPFPRAARLGRVEAWLYLGRMKEALAEFRKHPADHEEAPRILRWIAMKLEWKEDRAGAKALLRELISSYGVHPTSAAARVDLANILTEEKREEEAISLLEAVFKMRPSGSDLDDDSLDYARSEASRNLASLLEKRGDWNRSLLLWRDWVPATFCGTCARQMDDQRHYHLGLALEHLQQEKEALEEYWLAAPVIEEAAKSCRDLHARRGTLAVLQRQVEETSRKAKEHDAELQQYAGLRWLVEHLK
jgi:tetratricopeptide (TPR) repeat protein